MTVIDCHCHIYPEKIAERAVEGVHKFYDIKMENKQGTAAALLESCKGSPITHHIVYSVATRPDQVESINNFIAQQCAVNQNFIGFMTLHQDYENPEDEINRAVELGLHGLKLHPDTQAVNMDDPRLMRIYEAIEGRMPVVIHCGDYRYDYSHPRRLKNVLQTFPNLTVNAAHFGGWSIFDLAVEYLENENCFMDMSSSIAFIGDRRTRELVNIYGTDRILFGSDFPMWNPVAELKRFESLGFTSKELENMTWHNAERFLGKTIE